MAKQEKELKYVNLDNIENRINQRIERIEERLKRSSSGGWKYDEEMGAIVTDDNVVVAMTRDEGRDFDFDNAINNGDFLGKAKRDVEWLLKELKHYRKIK